MSHQTVSVGCFSLKFYGFTCFMIPIMTFSKSLKVHLLLQKRPHTNLSSFEDVFRFDQTRQSICVCNRASAVAATLPLSQAPPTSHRPHPPLRALIFTVIQHLSLPAHHYLLVRMKVQTMLMWFFSWGISLSTCFSYQTFFPEGRSFYQPYSIFSKLRSLTGNPDWTRLVCKSVIALDKLPNVVEWLGPFSVFSDWWWVVEFVTLIMPLITPQIALIKLYVNI